MTNLTTALQQRYCKSPPSQDSRKLVVGWEVVQSEEKSRGDGRKNWSICSEPSRARVSNEPSRWDSEEVTWNNTTEQERVPGEKQTHRDHRIRAAIAKLFSSTVTAVSIAVLFQQQIPKFYVHKGLDINKKEVRKVVCTCINSSTL